MPRLYPLGDRPTRTECERLGVGFKENRLPIWDAQPRRDGKYLQSLATGEFRPPLKGEWYLSGAKPTAYRASNDFNASYYIMRLVVVEQSTYVVKRIMTHKQATE